MWWSEYAGSRLYAHAISSSGRAPTSRIFSTNLAPYSSNDWDEPSGRSSCSTTTAHPPSAILSAAPPSFKRSSSVAPAFVYRSARNSWIRTM